MKMKQLSLVACLLFVAACALDTQKEFGDLDPEDFVDEDQFEEDFGLEKITDPVEKARRSIALQENEIKVNIQNEDYIEGKKTWWSEIDDFDDLPEDEFEAEKTGLNQPKYGRGLLRAYGPESRDEASERYFDRFRNSNADIPESYSSVEEGNVTPIRDQKQCGSCVAFATNAAVETCFKKLTGVFGDYSEQQLVDCGYRLYGANGCSGASAWAYTKYLVEKKFNMTHESRYPYLNMSPRYTCPNDDYWTKYDIRPHNLGARVTKTWYTQSGNEKMLKRLVYKHGAVITGVYSTGPFQQYAGGIFQGCKSRRANHAVTVVGYGIEKGEKYWLIKNSWGKSWGEDGYIRLLRGNRMCGVGDTVVTVSCGSVPGPTDPPMTTAVPCFDTYNNCAYLKHNCKKFGEKCTKSCGLCKGMTPHVSNKCPDSWRKSCPKWAKKGKCWKKKNIENCCLSCGLGEGMTPHPSHTCYDYYSNCGENRKRSCRRYSAKCKKTCGLC